MLAFLQGAAWAAGLRAPVPAGPGRNGQLLPPLPPAGAFLGAGQAGPGQALPAGWWTGPAVRHVTAGR